MNRLRMVTVIVTATTMCGGVSGVEIPETGPARVYPETDLVRDGEAACLIVAPTEQPWAGAAEAISRTLREAYAVDFPTVPHTEVCPARLGPVADEFREQHLILVGNVHTNRAMLGLYAGFALGADSYYPGGDGYELRTVANPWATGRNVLVVGASTPEGMTNAVAAFADLLPPLHDGSAVLPLTLEVEPGPELAPIFEASAAEAERWEFASFDTRDHVASRMYAIALRYHWTGDERWVAAARDVMRFFNEIYEGRYPISDYEFDPWFRGWDLIDEHPVFTEEERQLTIRRMLETAFAVKGYGHMGAGYAGTRHTTQGSLGGWTAARYLRGVFPDEAELQETLQRWQEGRREHFEHVLSGYRDDRDSTESMDSIVSFHRWALEAGFPEYFESGHARQSAQYCLTYHDSLGYTCGIDGYAEAVPGSLRTRYRLGYVFRALTMALDEPSMLWLHEHFPPCRGFGLHYWPPLWQIACFAPAPGVVASEGPPDYLLGLTALPISERRYEQVAAGAGRLPPGVSAQMPPHEHTVDKLCFRQGFDPEDQYLLLQGSQGALVGTVDANTIPRFTERGTVWLFHHTDQIGHYYRNGLFVSNGINNEALPSACRLDAAGRFDDLSLTATTLEGFHGTDWRRAIVWLPGEWFLVIDRAAVTRPGQYLAQCVWRTPLFGTWTDDRHFATTSGDATFHIISSHAVDGRAEAEPRDGAARPFVLRQRKSGEFVAGDTIGFQNLLTVTDAHAKPAWTPVRVTDAAAIVIADDGRRVLVGVGGTSPACGVTADAGMFALSDSALYLADVSRLEVGGRVVVSAPQPITARLDLEDGRLQAGHDGDALKAASLTWELPEGALPAGVEVDPAPLAEALDAIAAVGGPAGAREVATRGRVTEATGAVNVAWESAQVGRKGQPIGGLHISAEEGFSGPLQEPVNGLIPSWSGSLHWPQGEPARFELSWAQTESVDQLRIHIGMIATGDRPDLAEPVADEREVALAWSSDGFADDVRKQTVSAHRAVHLNNRGKGYIHPQGYLRLDTGGVEASAVRITVPPAGDGDTVYITEVEVLGPGRGPLAVAKPLVRDLDGDGSPEVIVHNEEGLLSVLSAYGELRWQHQFKGPVTCVATGDLTGDGRMELVCGCFDDQVHALTADGDVLWVTSFVGMRERSNSKYCENGSLPHTVGVWEPRAGEVRVLVGHYWYMSILDEAGEMLQCARVGGRHRVVLDPPLDLDGDGSTELLVSWDKPWQGTAGIAIAGDAEGIREDGIRTPNGIAYLAEILPGDTPRVALGTQEGFGLYDADAGDAIWEYMGGRPYSAGILHDTDGDGTPEFVMGGKDGFVTVVSQDGEAIAPHLIGDAVRDLAAVGEGDRSRYLVATDSGLRVYDARWHPAGLLPGAYAHIVAHGGLHLAVTADGRIRHLAIEG